MSNTIDYTQALSFATDVLCKITANNLWYHYLVSTVLILIIAFYFNYVLTSNKIVEKNGFLPAILFVLTASFYHQFNYVSNELISFLFVFISTMILYNTILGDSNHAGLFDAGFFLGIASLFYKPLVFLIFFILLVIIILRTVRIRDLLLSVLGFIIPFFLVGTYCFLINRFAFFSDHLIPSFTTSVNIFKKNEVWEYIKLITLSVLVIMGIFKGQTESIKSIVTVRKFYTLSLLMMMGIVLSLFFSETLTIKAFIFFAIPFSFYLYTIVKDLKRIWIAELIHVILSGLIFFTSIQAS